MAFGFFKINEGLRIKSKSVSTVAEIGDLDVTPGSATSKLNFYNGTTSSPVVTESHTATLTNKTMSGSNNTFTNIPSSAITSLTIDRVVITDSDGVLSVSSVTPTQLDLLSGVSAPIVTTTGTQTLTNKTISLSGNSLTGSANHVPVFNGSGTLISEAQLAVSRGGTGQSTASAAFDALSPTTTKGDLIISDGSNNIRVPVGTDGQVLKADSGQTAGVSWTSEADAKDSSDEITNLGIFASVTGLSSLLIEIRDKEGNAPSAGNPALLGFRDSTANIGTYNQRSVTSVTSLTISSGSTLGLRSSWTHFIYVYAIDNAGTVELAVSASLFDEGSLQTTTAEGGSGGADNAQLLYSATARTDVPIRLIGRLQIEEATIGTWNVSPNEITLVPFEIQNPAAVYTSDSGQSIPHDTQTIIDFEDTVQDTRNSVTTGASWNFKVPESGLYQIMACITFVSNSTSADFDLRLIVSGTVTRRLAQIFKSSSTYAPLLSGCATLELARGNTLSIAVRQNSGSAWNLTTDSIENYISITKIPDTKLIEL